MKIKEILKELHYYLSIRKTGKTTLLKKGIDEYPYYHWIVVPNVNYGTHIISPTNKLHKLVSLHNIKNIRGTHQAMIIEQEANLEIFRRSIDEIERLETDVIEKSKMINEILSLCIEYQSELALLYSYLRKGDNIPFWNFKARSEYKKQYITLINDIMARSKEYDKHIHNIKTYFNL